MIDISERKTGFVHRAHKNRLRLLLATPSTLFPCISQSSLQDKLKKGTQNSLISGTEEQIILAIPEKPMHVSARPGNQGLPLPPP